MELHHPRHTDPTHIAFDKIAFVREHLARGKVADFTTYGHQLRLRPLDARRLDNVLRVKGGRLEMLCPFGGWVNVDGYTLTAH